MTTRDEKLLETIKKLAGVTYARQITTLRRKLTKMETLKDNWRETALRYKAELQERKK